MKNLDVSVGCNAFRKYQFENHFSDCDLSAMLGVDRRTVRQVLDGNVLPSPALQRRLNRLLGIVNDWLFDDSQYSDIGLLEARGL